MRRILTSLLALAALPVPLAEEAFAQAVPEGSQATRVPAGYRRSPQFRVDPFRQVFIPRWGFVLSAGAAAENNALNFADVGAIVFLSDSLNNPDGILLGDVLDALSLVPRGSGAAGLGAGEAGLALGGPFGRHLSLGVSLESRGYGIYHLDDGAVALLRDGNSAIQEFPLGDTRLAVLAALELGAHAVWRFGPLGSEDGAELVLGFGGRYLRPYYYTRARTLIDSRVVVTDTTVAANVGVEKGVTLRDGRDGFDLVTNGTGAGAAADLLVRLEWPTSGFAVEALVANLGRVTVNGLERSTLSYNVETTNLKEVVDSLEAATFTVRDTVDATVTLPRVVRFGASGWANRVLQLDAAVTLGVSGEFQQPVLVDLGTTWRLLTSMPLRAGVALGGHQGFGYTAGIAFETQNLYLQFAGASLGGLFRHAKGAAGRVDIGFFF